MQRTSSTSLRLLRTPTGALSSAFRSKQFFATGQSVLGSPALRDVNGEPVEPKQLFSNKKVVLFGVVGAFTGTCSNKHVPSFKEASAELKAKGVDEIVCVTVNDHFVAKAWKDQLGFGNEITVLADSDASFSRSLGLDLDLSAAGLGLRSKRYSMLIENGVVKQENVANNPGEVENTGADTILASLQ